MHLAGLAAMPARPAVLSFDWRDLKPQIHADGRREKELNHRDPELRIEPPRELNRRDTENAEIPDRGMNRQARQGRQGDN